MKRATTAVAVTLLAALTAAGSAVPATGAADPATGPIGILAVPPTPQIAQTMATGLAAPWGLAFLPDGSALVSERNSAQIKRIANGAVTTIGTVPGVVPGGEGGLHGLAVASSFATDRLVYAYFTAANDNRVVRMRFDTGLGTPEVIVSGIPKATIHNGGRLAFGPDGMLYIATGDAGQSANSQNPSSLGGKILRVTPTGAAAPGNPTAGNRMFSLGHRNVQGLAFDGAGRLWASEFGQNTWDEVNLIQAGRNYGWPTVEGIGNNPNFVNPIVQWTTAEASPSGIAFASNTVWVASLRGQRLWGVPVLNGALDGSPVAFLNGTLGRLRMITTAPDGSLWLMTNNTDGRGTPRPGDDRIVRLTLGTGTNPDTTPPTVPGTPSVSNVTSNSASLSFAASTDAGGSGLAGYNVHREQGANDPILATPTTNSATLTGLTPSTQYQIYVRARDGAGNLSNPSASVTFTTPAGPGGTGPCRITYSATNWGGGNGFTANLTVANTGTSTINGWTLAFAFPSGQRITQPGWNATWTQGAGSANVTATDLGHNGTLAPSASASIGFNGTFTGANPAPTAFTLNGTSCTTG